MRSPAVAGTFYPADPESLRSSVEALLVEAVARRSDGPAPKALVAPHAGYVYSGGVAATAYAEVTSHGRVERVVLLGPAHRYPLAAVAAPDVDALVTPLGTVPVDTAAVAELLREELVVLSNDAHAGEHSLEVHLPFLQVALGGVRVLPLTVGDVPASSVADVLDRVWDGPETLIVASTDLSHYYDQATATALDRQTAATITACRPEALRPDDACGVYALRGLLAAARRHGLAIRLLDLRTSADASGPRDRVVGYGAFALC